MNHFERIKATLKGLEVDRVPYAFWTHFPGIDMVPERLAKKTVEFYRTYDIDFIKMMSNGMYAIEDFGCTCDYSEIEKGGVARVIKTPVETPEDWAKIEALPLTVPALSRELRSLELILDEIGDEVPVIFIVFSPLTIALKLSDGKVMDMIRAGHGDLVKPALSAIADTVSRLSQRAIEMGAAGVFFATQMATYDATTEEEYLEYGKVYDEQALKGAEKGWMNTIHLHGKNIMFDLIADYPAEFLNWHVWETEPEIAEGLKRTKMAIMGGINRYSITENDRPALETQISKAIEQTGGTRHILTPGCVIRYPLMDEALTYVNEVRKSVCSK